MPAPAVAQALEEIYASLQNGNEGIDARIAALKAALQAEGAKDVEVDPARLAAPNRQGRKTMQSYFRQRGVIVNFKEKA